ncbi:YbaM family protein [Psychromonas aquatilis]|uniref:YbaM family protein n=1 Tax=Psychromonas aquatilis TaxID=2005072 RepID=A0ABU9GNL4_9GAMM
MTNDINSAASSLEDAPLEIKLAVDLIQLLEENDFPLETTINALEIVLKDFKNKRT